MICRYDRLLPSSVSPARPRPAGRLTGRTSPPFLLACPATFHREITPWSRRRTPPRWNLAVTVLFPRRYTRCPPGPRGALESRNADIRLSGKRRFFASDGLNTFQRTRVNGHVWRSCTFQRETAGDFSQPTLRMCFNEWKRMDTSGVRVRSKGTLPRVRCGRWIFLRLIVRG